MKGGEMLQGIEIASVRVVPRMKLKEVECLHVPLDTG